MNNGLTFDITGIIISVIGTLLTLLIGMLAFFIKKQIKTIDEAIKTLNMDIIAFKEASFRECSLHRQTMYNDFYKRDLLDERKETLEQRVKRIEEKMNGHIR